MSSLPTPHIATLPPLAFEPAEPGADESWDECRDRSGALRPSWQRFFDAAPALGTSGGHAAEVYVWPQSQRKRNDRGQHGALHAKFVAADRATLFVSSANLTEHAMSLNLELGVLIRGGVEPARATAMIDSLIQRGILVRLT